MSSIFPTKNRRWQTILFVVLALSLGAVPAAMQQIDVAQAKYDNLIAEGQFQEAANSLKEAISSLIQDPMHDRLLYARMLTQLAIAQHEMDSYDAAEENYLLAIEVIQDERDRLSNELVAPMLGLSRTYQAAGRYQEAVKSYRDTLHIHQVNNGLYGGQKAQIVAELSEAYFAQGDFERANAMQDSYVNIVGRDHAGDNLDRLPSMYSRADMFLRTGHSDRALKAYKRIISMIERADGARSLKLLPALIKISRLLLDYEIMDGDHGFQKALRYMRRAIYIVEKTDSADAHLKSEIYIAVGDFLSVHAPDRTSVINNYRRGWDELSKEERYMEARDSLFAEPILLNPVPVDSSEAILELLDNAAEPGTSKNGIVIVNYDIDESGQPENVRVVKSVPPGNFDYIVSNHVRLFAFRPRFVDGAPVASRNRVFEIRFSYDQEDLPEKARSNGTEVVAAEAAR